MNTPKLTDREIFLGEFYLWVHWRAQYLRQQREASREVEPITDEDTSVPDSDQSKDNPSQ